MIEQRDTPSEISADTHGVDGPPPVPTGDPADARRRWLLAAGAKGLFTGPIILTLANRPAFGSNSQCNFSAGASVNPSHAKTQGGDKSDVWYGRPTWPSNVTVTVNRGTNFASAFGISSYWNVSSSSYVKVGNVQNASFSLENAINTSGTDGNVVYWAKKSGTWNSFSIGAYCREATAAYLNELNYKGNFPIVGVVGMVHADFANFATSALTNENTSNYRSFSSWNNNCP